MVLDAEMSEVPKEGQPPMQDIVMAKARSEVSLEELDPRVGKELEEEIKKELKDFLRKNSDVFAWRHEDMIGIYPKVYPKDSFPLPRIDQLVYSTAGHELLNFMDTYSDYNQIPMFPGNEESTSFITDRGLYCYKVMPFGLKNSRTTYQRLVNKMFAYQLGKTMEV
ncbi:unnamed protein product [Fraxinus pennsylvanica]|uniref:Reverse transcriptase domain-containing protein n=1 Tax=Fraxinus pennsylvanica TaxID=56036 RepID=A0AAD1ZB50_9LAMI|nr:unnamed protein product [Fraxinus pennsylvanica]